MTAGEALEQPLIHLGQMLQRRQVTATALAEEALRRLDKRGRALNAVAALMPDRARAEAAQADRELAAGKWKGPLHGVPYGAKDLLSARGAPTTWGTRIFQGRVIDEDAAVIGKLAQAGAVLVAKLSMVQLAGGFGYHRAAASLTGPGKNPYDPGRWAGGSSSGSGAAVAARCVPFAIGSETWGSILTPSALCGISGLRPTFGRVSRTGAMALAYSMDKLGPMAIRAQDAAIVLRAIAGPDPRDPAAAEHPPELHPGRVLSGRPAIGLLLPESMKKKDPQVYAAHEAVAQALGKVARVERAEVPSDLPAEQAAQLTIAAEEASAFEDLIDQGKLSLLESTDGNATARADRSISAADYLRAQRVRGKLREAYARAFSRYEAFCAPSLGFVAAVAPRLEEDLDSALDGPDPLGGAGNLLGLPAIALPGPLVRGLPTGMCLVGPAWSEDLILAVATALQAATRWHDQKPPAR
ncbi:MAG TPA: amidase [Myxococcales bacterium]|jgi:aspartyl-tRNA(Asn)/glutamyl-tRNA(Gln) amidotransferase subunit A|nr:amidase [Myxococcales bacterium]